MASAMAPAPNHIHQIPSHQPYPHPPQTDYARVVADQFVQQYYMVLKSYANHLHRFYMEDSSLTISGKDGLNESRTASGGNIQNLVMEHLPVAQAEYHSFEAQLVRVPGYAVQEPVFFNSTPILIQVSGSLSVGGKDYSFVQTFFLAPLPGAHKGSGFYVANDILRLSLLKPEGPKAVENGFMPVSAPPSLDAVVDHHTKGASAHAPPNTLPPAQAIPDPAAQPVPQTKAASPPRRAPTPEVAQSTQPPPQPAPVVPSQPPQLSINAAPAVQPAPSSPVRSSPPPKAAPAAPSSPAPAPAPAQNLTYAERVKLNMQQAAAKAAAAAASAAQQASKPAVATSSAAAPASQRPPSSTSAETADHPKADTPAAGSDPDEAPSTSVLVQDLPDVSAQEVLEEFQKFGIVKGGVAGISIKPYRDRFSAQFDYETRDALEAACSAEVILKETKVKVVEKRPYSSRKDSRGRSGRFGGNRGERGGSGFSRRPPPAGAPNGTSERGGRGGRGGYHGEGRGDGSASEGPRSDSRGEGRGEGRGRGRGEGRGRGRGGRGRGDRQSEGPRAPSPAAAES